MTADGVYFGAGGDALFGMLHRPHGNVARATAIVVVPPLGYEAICAERTLRHLARRLAQRGFWVLRYDHLGTGDSAGDALDPERLAAWVTGVRRASVALVGQVGATGVALVGLRAGALLALGAARGESEIKSLVLWAPPPTGRSLVRELRALSGFGGADKRATDHEECAGFAFADRTLAELSLLEARALAPPASARVLIVPRDDIAPPPPSAFGEWVERAELAALPGYAAMMRDPHESVVPEPTLDAIAGWLDSGHPEVGANDHASPKTRVELLASATSSVAVTEEAVRFGAERRLFGIVTEPNGEAAGPFVLWLNPGAIHRIGMNRNYVGFARALAARGVTSLRFDVSGFGDSRAGPGISENQLYSEHVVPDVIAAMDFLAGTRGARELVLAGLCSGAYAAFHAALADARVSGVVLINPQTFKYRPGDSLAIERRNAIKAARWYRRAARDTRSWKKALRGEVDFARVARLLGERAISVAQNRLAALAPPPAERRLLAEAFKSLLERGTRTLLLYSSDDPGLLHLRERLGRDLDVLRDDPRFGLEVIEGPDHTFTPLWSQALLGDRITQHLVEHHGARELEREAGATPTRSLVSAARRGAKRAIASVVPHSWLLVRGPRTRRRIALTFDDGPTELTRDYLDVLERYGVHATFFLVGRACAQLPEQARSIAQSGHEIGGHGFTHRTFPELHGTRLRRELEATEALLPGEKNGRRLVRPPHGSMSPRSLFECARAGFTTVLWSYDSGDSRAQTPAEILEAFDRNPPEAGDIVLLHEDHHHTLEALPALLDRLVSAGYELVTVRELFQPGAGA